jgi:hypothetical protein
VLRLDIDVSDEEVEVVRVPTDRDTQAERRATSQCEPIRLGQATDDVEQPLLERRQHGSSIPHRSASQAAQARRTDRPHRSFSPVGRARHVPCQGAGRGLAQGRGGRPGSFRCDRGGRPQGGVVSPLLLTIALHGMEQAAGVHYQNLGPHVARVRRGSPVVIRYADDLVALCHSREHALEVKAKLAGWLAPRGLAFNEDKTQVVSVDDGFDFLGFNVRRYNGKLLIKPSVAAVKRIRERLRVEIKALRGADASAVPRRINPIVRGWSAYYRTVVSTATFAALDDYMWSSPTGGPPTATTTSRSPGSLPGTSDSSTWVGRTDGCSVTTPVAPTSRSSPGPGSSGTRWSEGRHHLMIPPLAATGPSGVGKDHPHR